MVMLMVFFQVWRVGVSASVSASFLGSWSDSKECVWNLGKKIMLQCSHEVKCHADCSRLNHRA